MARLRRLARGADSPFHLAVAGPEPTPLEGFGEALGVAEAEIVEGGADRLAAHSVGAPSASAFTAFLDGIQRSAVALYHGPVPIVYAYAAAVIRARSERRMTTLTAADAGRDGTRYSTSARRLLSIPHLARIRAVGVGCALFDTGPRGEPLRLRPRSQGPPGTNAGGIARARSPTAGAESARLAPGRRQSHPVADVGREPPRGRGGQEPSHAFLRWRRCPHAPGARCRGAHERVPAGNAELHAGLLVVPPPPVGRRAGRLLRAGARGGRRHGGDERADEISRWILAETAPLSLPDAR